MQAQGLREADRALPRHRAGGRGARRAGGCSTGPVVVLLSGGRDSVCLLDVAVARWRGPVTALHVNYGLRAEADADEAYCRALCERLGVPLGGPPRRRRPRGQPPGVGARRALRRGGAARARAARRRHRPHGDRPGRDRALPPGRLAGPAGAARDAPSATGGSCARCWHDARGDRGALPRARACRGARTRPTTTPAYARNRVRHGLLPALRALHPAAEANVLRTLELLRDEAEVLDAVVDARRSSRRTSSGWPRCRRRCGGSRCRRSPTRRGGRSAPACRRDPRARRRAAARRRSTSAAACGPWSSTGGCGSTTGPGRAAGRRGPARCPGASPTAPGASTCERRPTTAPFDADRARLRELEVRPGAPATACARSASAAAARCRTCSPTARSRASAAPAAAGRGRCDGEIAWVPGVATGERVPRHAGTTRGARVAACASGCPRL